MQRRYLIRGSKPKIIFRTIPWVVLGLIDDAWFYYESTTSSQTVVFWGDFQLETTFKTVHLRECHLDRRRSTLYISYHIDTSWESLLKTSLGVLKSILSLQFARLLIQNKNTCFIFLRLNFSPADYLGVVILLSLSGILWVVKHYLATFFGGYASGGR